MADVPGDAGQDSEKKPNDETKPKATEKNREPEADNTAEIVGTAVGGILTTIAGIVGVAGLSLWALWFGFFSLCCYLVSFGSWLREHTGLPARPLRFVTALFLFALLASCVYLHGVIRAHDAEEARKDRQLNNLETSAADTKRQLAEQHRQRHLTADQKSALKQTIAPFAGQKITVIPATGDAEAGHYAKEFAEVFREAGLECGPLKSSFLPGEFKNTLAVASQELDKAEEKNRVAPLAYHPLAMVLVNLKLSDNAGLDILNQINISQSVKPGELGLFVGPKPPPDDIAP